LKADAVACGVRVEQCNQLLLQFGQLAACAQHASKEAHKSEAAQGAKAAHKPEEAQQVSKEALKAEALDCRAAAKCVALAKVCRDAWTSRARANLPFPQAARQPKPQTLRFPTQIPLYPGVPPPIRMRLLRWMRSQIVRMRKTAEERALALEACRNTGHIFCSHGGPRGCAWILSAVRTCMSCCDAALKRATELLRQHQCSNSSQYKSPYLHWIGPQSLSWMEQQRAREQHVREQKAQEALSRKRKSDSSCTTSLKEMRQESTA
jgi:hypothetical protein